MRAYLADPEEAAETWRQKFREMIRQHSPENETGDSESSSSSATITFQLSPEAIAEDRERPFPPNPWRIPVG